MKESEWLATASKLHKDCFNEQKENNGSKEITKQEATKLNLLQAAIGSHHSRHQVTYNEAVESLNEMFDMVKGKQKTPPLTQG